MFNLLCERKLNKLLNFKQGIYNNIVVIATVNRSKCQININR